MMKDMETDILVVGSGIAGISAALTAQRRGGVNVTLIEKRPFQGGGVSNTPMMTMAVKDDPAYRDRAFRTHMDYCNWNANSAAVRSWIVNSARIPGFIRDLGLDFLAVVETPLEEIGQKRGYCGGFPNGYNLGDYYFLKAIGRGHGAAVIIKKAADKFVSLGGTFIRNCALKELLTENDAVTGAVAKVKGEGETRINAKAVILASGGFSDNAEMIKTHLGFNFTDVNCSNGGDVLFNTFPGAQMTGDAQQAVWAIGGAKGPMGVNGHNLVPGPGIIGNVPWIVRNQMRTVQEQPCLWVNALGERFISEDMANDHMAMGTAIANQPDRVSYLIFDEDTKLHFENKGIDYVYHIFPAEKLEHVTRQFEQLIHEAGNKHAFVTESLDELADKAGIDATGLKATVEKYNAYCEKKHDDEFSKNPAFLRPVRRPKFYALRCFTGGYQAQGGIAADGKMRVLKKDRRAFRGLYAAGDCASGSLWGDPIIGGIGISTMCFSMGFAAADEAVAYVNGK
jgi:fumarate reductase flavoprotein subunit